MSNQPSLKKQLIQAMKSLPQDTEIQEIILALEAEPMHDNDYAHTLKFILLFLHRRPEMLYASAHSLKELSAECRKHVAVVDEYEHGVPFKKRE